MGARRVKFCNEVFICDSKTRKHSQQRVLYLKHNGRCYYCDNIVIMTCNPVYEEVGRHARASRDHVYPRSMGGANDLTNLVLSCMLCNEAKADTIIGGGL